MFGIHSAYWILIVMVILFALLLAVAVRGLRTQKAANDKHEQAWRDTCEKAIGLLATARRGDWNAIEALRALQLELLDFQRENDIHQRIRSALKAGEAELRFQGLVGNLDYGLSQIRTDNLLEKLSRACDYLRQFNTRLTADQQQRLEHEHGHSFLAAISLLNQVLIKLWNLAARNRHARMKLHELLTAPEYADIRDKADLKHPDGWNRLVARQDENPELQYFARPPRVRPGELRLRADKVLNGWNGGDDLDRLTEIKLILAYANADRGAAQEIGQILLERLATEVRLWHASHPAAEPARLPSHVKTAPRPREQ